MKGSELLGAVEYSVAMAVVVVVVGLLLLAVAPLAPASRILSPAKAVTLSNSEPRLDTAGEIVDCHSGNFVHFKVTLALAWGVR